MSLDLTLKVTDILFTGSEMEGVLDLLFWLETYIHHEQKPQFLNLSLQMVYDLKASCFMTARREDLGRNSVRKHFLTPEQSALFKKSFLLYIIFMILLSQTS